MQDQETTIGEIRKAIAEFVHARDWEASHNPKNLAMCVAIEAAELMEIFQWCTVEEGDGLMQDGKTAEHTREEIADVAIYLLSLCNRLGVDLSAAIEDKMRKNDKRFPRIGE